MSCHEGAYRLKKLGETEEAQFAGNQKTGPGAPKSASIPSIGLKIRSERTGRERIARLQDEGARKAL
jgi:hypothetical protein